jgi:hypothetical protein
MPVRRYDRDLDRYAACSPVQCAVQIAFPTWLISSEGKARASGLHADLGSEVLILQICVLVVRAMSNNVHPDCVAAVPNVPAPIHPRIETALNEFRLAERSNLCFPLLQSGVEKGRAKWQLLFSKCGELRGSSATQSILL